MAEASPTTLLAIFVIVLSTLLMIGALTTVFLVTLDALKDRPGRRRRRQAEGRAGSTPRAAA